MLYTALEMQKAWLAGAGMMAGWTSSWLDNRANPLSYAGPGPAMAAALDVFAHAAAPRGKPEFGLKSTMIEGVEVPVREEIVLRKPFGQLKQFIREGREGDPKLLIIAPMSGHFATLLRGTVERLLPGHDVWITDWRDARDVPLSEGNFDLDDYVDYLISFLEAIGPGAHALAVCQPSVPAYVATALMNANAHPCRPRTLTMMGGPIDTRQAPTAVNALSTERPLSWFRETVIAKVPSAYKGAGRAVYPGVLQLSGFMTMNLGNHMKSHWRMVEQLIEGNDMAVDATKAFYDEYRSTCDMTAEFYLQTVDRVFQQHLVAKNAYVHRDVPVDAAAIRDTALLAIEGERDDISGLGQTRAALDLATSLPEAMKQYHMAKGAGHYGIFNGAKWRDEVAPVVEAWIAAHN